MRIVFTFYRNILFPSSVVNLCSCYALFGIGNTYAISTLFNFKVAISILLGLYIHIFRGQQLYFYLNLGYSRTKLYSLALLIDLVIWLFLLLILLPFL